ncbi:type VI secretion system baseplate subunit TssF [Gilliamella sp. Pas-s25]|uniref:type VI secretion system baseplate subunit TssF n=1 Tax=Gilliamella sp. Pas-s25 TaxID=2687310 RepID=UPI00135EC366|nr:type VI secretion system baseplate subunit TssF [Gilliamella sp. Pas-s25]MWP62707.1 type VI secretion system baseplate subunit TssF [Gilliamella sp. Pas-s25]
MELKDFYQDEISYIKLLARDIAEKHPELDAFFSASTDDADVERILEGNSLLIARLRQKIDDAFPEITHALLDEVWSTPINPIPATTIFEFTPERNGEIIYIPPEMHVQSSKNPGTEDHYIFQTRREVRILPLQIINRKIVHSNEGSQLTLTFEWYGNSKQIDWEFTLLPLFLGENKQTAGLLLLWFSHYLKNIQIRVAGEEYSCSNKLVNIKTPTAENLLLPCNGSPYWRLQLLQEYFYTDHVNDFIEFDISYIKPYIRQGENTHFEVVFNFNQAFPFDNLIDEQVFRLYCVPGINKFLTVSHPISFDSAKKTPTGFMIKPNNPLHEIYRIQRVYSPDEAHRLGRGGFIEYKPITKFSPTRYTFNETDIFYKIDREHDVIGNVIHKLSFFDHKGEPTDVTNINYFICELECINRQEVKGLNINEISTSTGDVPSGIAFTNITKVSKPFPAIISSHVHWPLISHLSLSPIFLNDINVIRQVVQDFDIHSKSNRPAHNRLKQFLLGIENVISHPVDRLVNGLPLRGVQLEFYLNPDFYPDKGEMFRLGVLLGNFFAYCITNNSFLLTKIINTQTKECWILPQISGSKEQI